MSDEQTKDRPVYTEGAGREFLDGFLANKDGDDTAKEGATADASDMPLQEQVIAVLRDIYDPEIPVNIYELGLIYDVAVDGDNNIIITMTLTTPHCPVAETMPNEIKVRVEHLPAAEKVDINLVWEPAWDPSRMSEEARLELGFI